MLYLYKFIYTNLFIQNYEEQLNLKFLLENPSLKANFDLQSYLLSTISRVNGYVEAEGSFFIVKHKKYYAFEVYIAQKEYPIRLKKSFTM